MTTEMLKDEVKISTDIYNKDVDRSELYSAKFQLQQAQRAIIDAKGSIIKPLELLNNLSGCSPIYVSPSRFSWHYQFTSNRYICKC